MEEKSKKTETYAKQFEDLYEAGKINEAIKYLHSVAKQGNADAQYDLGCCYGIGQDVEKNINKAIQYYQLAADQGHAIAQYNLARCYEIGQDVEKNINKAIQYYQLAADQGHAIAQYNLGLCYGIGKGVDKDPKKAVRYWQLAADQGNAVAQYNLGLCYETRQGVEKNINKAIRYYRLAANQGNVKAQYNLACCYIRGEGVEKNINKAIQYWRSAADIGYFDAKTKLELYDEFEKMQVFFQKLLENDPSLIFLIPKIEPIKSRDELIIFFDSSHLHYETLIENIKTLSSFFDIKGNMPKSVILKTSKIKSSGDSKKIQSIFQLKQTMEKDNQFNEAVKSKGIKFSGSEVVEPFKTEPFYLSTATTSSPKQHVPKKPPNKTTSTFFATANKPGKPQFDKNKPTNQHKKGHSLNKKPVQHANQAVNKMNTVKPPLKKEINLPLSRELPNSVKMSLRELEIVRRYSVVEYEILPAKSASLAAKRTLSFKYYEGSLPGGKTIALPNEKQTYLNELLNVLDKLQTPIQNPPQNLMATQAFLYDFFFLLELIQNTFDSVENINDIILLRDITQLRQLMKTIVCNQQKQNANVANWVEKAKKICSHLKSLNDALQSQQLSKIEQLRVTTENLITEENQVKYQYNPTFFKDEKNTDGIEIKFSDLCICMQEYLQYIKIVEDDLKSVEEKSSALSAAEWCVLTLGLKENQALFKANMEKSDALDHILRSLRMDRNQLAHGNEYKNSDKCKNPIMNEETVRNLKKPILELQQLGSKSGGEYCSKLRNTL